MVTHTVLTARSMWEHSFHAEQTRRPRCPTLESPVGVCAGARVARQKPVTRVSGACGDRSAHRQPQALKGSSDGRPVNGDRAPSPGPADGTASRGDGAQGRYRGCTPLALGPRREPCGPRLDKPCGGRPSVQRVTRTFRKSEASPTSSRIRGAQRGCQAGGTCSTKSCALRGLARVGDSERTRLRDGNGIGVQSTDLT